MLRRIRELAAETAADHIPGQHVLTKAILRRFAADSGPDKGLIYPFRLEHPQARHQLLGPELRQGPGLHRLCIRIGGAAVEGDRG